MGASLFLNSLSELYLSFCSEFFESNRHVIYIGVLWLLFLILCFRTYWKEHTLKHTQKHLGRTWRRQKGRTGKGCRYNHSEEEEKRKLISTLKSFLPPGSCSPRGPYHNSILFRQLLCPDPSCDICNNVTDDMNRMLSSEPLEDSMRSVSPLASKSPVTKPSCTQAPAFSAAPPGDLTSPPRPEPVPPQPFVLSPNPVTTLGNFQSPSPPAEHFSPLESKLTEHHSLPEPKDSLTSTLEQQDSYQESPALHPTNMSFGGDPEAKLRDPKGLLSPDEHDSVQQYSNPKPSKQNIIQLFWGLPSLHSESLKSVVRGSGDSSVTLIFNSISDAGTGHELPGLPYVLPSTMSEVKPQPMVQTPPQSQPQVLPPPLPEVEAPPLPEAQPIPQAPPLPEVEPPPLPEAQPIPQAPPLPEVEAPPLPEAQPRPQVLPPPLPEVEAQPLLQTPPQSQSLPFTQIQPQAHLQSPIRILPSGPRPQIRVCEMSLQKLQNETRCFTISEIQQLERNVLKKKLESLWGLPSVVQRSQKKFCSSAPTSPCHRASKAPVPISIDPGEFPLSSKLRQTLEDHLKERSSMGPLGDCSDIHKLNSYDGHDSSKNLENLDVLLSKSPEEYEETDEGDSYLNDHRLSDSDNSSDKDMGHDLEIYRDNSENQKQLENEHVSKKFEEIKQNFPETEHRRLLTCGDSSIQQIVNVHINSFPTARLPVKVLESIQMLKSKDTSSPSLFSSTSSSSINLISEENSKPGDFIPQRRSSKSNSATTLNVPLPASSLVGKEEQGTLSQSLSEIKQRLPEEARQTFPPVTNNIIGKASQGPSPVANICPPQLPERPASMGGEPKDKTNTEARSEPVSMPTVSRANHVLQPKVSDGTSDGTTKRPPDIRTQFLAELTSKLEKRNRSQAQGMAPALHEEEKGIRVEQQREPWVPKDVLSMDQQKNCLTGSKQVSPTRSTLKDGGDGLRTTQVKTKRFPTPEKTLGNKSPQILSEKGQSPPDSVFLKRIKTFFQKVTPGVPQQNGSPIPVQSRGPEEKPGHQRTTPPAEPVPSAVKPGKAQRAEMQARAEPVQGRPLTSREPSSQLTNAKPCDRAALLATQGRPLTSRAPSSQLTNAKSCDRASLLAAQGRPLTSREPSSQLTNAKPCDRAALLAAQGRPLTSRAPSQLTNAKSCDRASLLAAQGRPLTSREPSSQLTNAKPCDRAALLATQGRPLTSREPSSQLTNAKSCDRAALLAAQGRPLTSRAPSSQLTNAKPCDRASLLAAQGRPLTSREPSSQLTNAKSCDRAALLAAQGRPLTSREPSSQLTNAKSCDRAALLAAQGRPLTSREPSSQLTNAKPCDRAALLAAQGHPLTSREPSSQLTNAKSCDRAALLAAQGRPLTSRAPSSQLTNAKPCDRASLLATQGRPLTSREPSSQLTNAKSCDRAALLAAQGRPLTSREPSSQLTNAKPCDRAALLAAQGRPLTSREPSSQLTNAKPCDRASLLAAQGRPLTSRAPSSQLTNAILAAQSSTSTDTENQGRHPQSTPHRGTVPHPGPACRPQAVKGHCVALSTTKDQNIQGKKFPAAK